MHRTTRPRQKRRDAAWDALDRAVRRDLAVNPRPDRRTEDLLSLLASRRVARRRGDASADVERALLAVYATEMEDA